MYISISVGVEFCSVDVFVGALSSLVVIVKMAASQLEFLDKTIAWPPVNLQVHRTGERERERERESVLT